VLIKVPGNYKIVVENRKNIFNHYISILPKNILYIIMYQKNPNPNFNLYYNTGPNLVILT